MAELQPIIVFHSRHLVRHLGICNRICVILKLISDVITHNYVEKEVSILINGLVAANYSVSRPPLCPPSWNCNPICVKQVMSGVISSNSQKKMTSLSQTFFLRPTNADTHTHTHNTHARTHTHTHSHTHTHTHTHTHNTHTHSQTTIA